MTESGEEFPLRSGEFVVFWVVGLDAAAFGVGFERTGVLGFLPAVEVDFFTGVLALICPAIV